MKRWLFLLALVAAFAPVPAASQHPPLTVRPWALHLSAHTHASGALSLEADAPNVQIVFDHYASNCESHHIAVVLGVHEHTSPPGRSHYEATVAPLRAGTCDLVFKGNGAVVRATIFVEP